MKKTVRTSRNEHQVQALFLDYDGTISPLDVPRFESVVPSENMAVLNQIGLEIPVAMVTTKDISFVVDRTPFARAWSVLGGLETKIGDTVTKESCLKERAPHIVEALGYVKSLSDNHLEIEEKLDSGGVTVAFSVDWREAKDRRKAVAQAAKILSHCKELQLATIEYEGQPFLDVFPCAIDKGKGLLKLKKALGLRGGVLYMGDSSVDNSAFETADISVGVIQRETRDDLVCDHFVRFEDVAAFLQGLLENDFWFTPEMRTILNRAEALRYIKRKKST